MPLPRPGCIQNRPLFSIKKSHNQKYSNFLLFFSILLKIGMMIKMKKEPLFKIFSQKEPKVAQKWRFLEKKTRKKQRFSLHSYAPSIMPIFKGIEVNGRKLSYFEDI